MAKVKTVNDEVRVQALINGKKITIKEYSPALVLKPPPGINLATLWHQQSYVLPQTRSLTSPVDHQLGDMSHHQDIYDNPSLTKKVFVNMKRVGIGFSRVITLLFKSILVQAAEEVGEAQDDNNVIEQVKRSKKQDNAVMRYQALKRKLVTEAQARKNMMIYLKNMAGFKIDFFKGMTYSEIKPIFEKHYNSIQDFLEKVEEEVTVQEEEPKNFSYDFLLNTLKIMFKKENVEANMFLLVEKKYPLTHFTLQQMLNNVILKVKEESEMSLELL
nr:hypothetical protein [Tanacetum cinerariifolium]